MNEVLIYFFVALGLSMDAFSLAIVYGVNNISFKKMLILSLLVGVFHFFMPLVGGNIGVLLQTRLAFGSNLIVGIVFLILSFSMLHSLKEEEEVISLDKFYYFIIFAFTVCLDSLSVGIAYGILKEEMMLASFIFSFVSFAFTLIGLMVGSLCGKKFGKSSKIIGAFILLFLSIKYLFL